MPPALPLRDWEEPRVTSNAHLLHGYIAGVVDRDADRRGEDALYHVEQLHGELIVKSSQGNRFRVTVEQISGEE